MRVVFLGTPEFARPVLRMLHMDPRFDVVLTVTQPDLPAGRGRKVSPSPVKQYALTANLPVFQPRRLSRPEAVERIASVRPDVLVIAAYGQLLRPAVLALPPHGCLNVHPSLLPRHRGPAPVAAAILAGDDQTGVTVMLTDAGMDTGPILTQTVVPLRGTETTASLTPRLADLGAALLQETLPRWVEGSIEPQPQVEARATVSRLFMSADGLLDWRRSAGDLARQVRALNPWPRAYTFIKAERVLLLNAIPADHPNGVEALPGTVLGVERQALRVATGCGELLVLEAQAAGRRAIPGAALMGQRGLRAGDLFAPAPAPHGG